VKARELQVADLVLKLVIQSAKEKKAGKLEPNSEGPLQRLPEVAMAHTP